MSAPVKTREQQEELARKFGEIVWEANAEFYRAYMRDDFFEVWLAQPEAFRENATAVMKFLSHPKSRKGVWKNNRTG